MNETVIKKLPRSIQADSKIVSRSIEYAAEVALRFKTPLVIQDADGAIKEIKPSQIKRWLARS